MTDYKQQLRDQLEKARNQESNPHNPDNRALTVLIQMLAPLKDDKFRERFEESKEGRAPVRPGLRAAVQLMYRADVLNHEEKGEVLIE